jgi:hypothetical protein
VFSPCSLSSSRQSFSCDLLNFHKFVEHLYNIDLSACAQLLLGIIDSFRIDLSYNIAVLLACFVNRLRDFTLGRASKTLCFAQTTRVAFCRRDSCDFACARLSVFSPTTFEIWSERERYDRHSFAMACSAPSIGLLLSPSIGVGGRALPSSSSSQSTSAFTPSSQQQHYNISSCFLTTSNKLRLSTLEGFQQVWIIETPPYMSETWKPKLLLCFEDSLVQAWGIGLFDSLNYPEQEIHQSTRVSGKKEVICMEHGKHKRM